jgi:CBS domain-containing protein
MQGVVATCGPEQSLGELTELLSLHQISGAPVVDDQGNLLGVVSQSDVAAYLGGLYSDEIRGAAGFYQGYLGRFSSADPAVLRLLETQSVRDLLTPLVYSIGPEASLDEVIDLMLSQHVHRLPVVDQGKLVGLVSTLDVLRFVRDWRGPRERD